MKLIYIEEENCKTRLGRLYEGKKIIEKIRTRNPLLAESFDEIVDSLDKEEPKVKVKK